MQGSETSWEFIENFEDAGFGSFKHIPLASGIEMLFVDFVSENSIESTFRIEDSPLMFSFHLSGWGQGDICNSILSKEIVPCGPGRAILSYNPDATCHTKAYEEQHFKILNLYISPEKLREILAHDLGVVPKDLRPVIENFKKTPFNNVCEISPAVRMNLDQIFNCPYDGTLGKLYMESKALELVVHQLGDMSHTCKPALEMKLSGSDREKIEFARDILIGNLENPPSLKDLAKMAGLNDTKLKRGFRQIYGTTVFEYLRRYRINRSKDILDSGGMNIDETALLLGFHDTAHFIRQFKQSYGTTPGAYLKQIKGEKICRAV